MQRLPFPHLVAQRYDHGELQAAVSGVVQNDVPDELHKKGILHQRTPEDKEEIERHGGKVVAAIFYGKTFSMPPMSVVRMSVWGDSISHAIKGRKKS